MYSCGSGERTRFCRVWPGRTLISVSAAELLPVVASAAMIAGPPMIVVYDANVQHTMIKDLKRRIIIRFVNMNGTNNDDVPSTSGYSFIPGGRIGARPLDLWGVPMCPLDDQICGPGVSDDR
jgi:hypothetical protein